ncbi:MAG: hypothetical protein MUE85_18105 [Microscillaceae bacterium]|jgi:hypothetical protein|nr:hypothetical protein [Microscillaceae bacterium]
MLTREIRENSSVKVGLAILAGTGALVSLIDIIENGKLTVNSLLGIGLSILTINESIEDIEDVIDERPI